MPVDTSDNSHQLPSWTSFRLCTSKGFAAEDKDNFATDDQGGRLHDGFQKLPCPILTVSASTRQILFANQSALQLFGWGWMPQSQLSQRRVEELFHSTNSPSEGNDLQENPILLALQTRARVAAEDVYIRLHNGDQKRTSVTHFHPHEPPCSLLTT